MSFVIFNYVEKRKYDKRNYLCIIFISLILFGYFIFNINTTFDNLKNRKLKDDLIELLRNEEVKRLYNFYDYGGELVYNDISVFIDGRADLYSKYNYNDYLNISLLQGDYIKLIDKYNFDYFLVNSNYPISVYLSYNDDYKKIYDSSDVVLYKKNS